MIRNNLIRQESYGILGLCGYALCMCLVVSLQVLTVVLKYFVSKRRRFFRPQVNKKLHINKSLHKRLYLLLVGLDKILSYLFMGETFLKGSSGIYHDFFLVFVGDREHILVFSMFFDLLYLCWIT